MRKIVRRLVLLAVSVLFLIVLLIGGYVAYMQHQYYRIEDNITLEIEHNQRKVAQIGQTYQAMTYNIGFGAYSQAYSFFLDSAYRQDGTYIEGQYGKGISRDDVWQNTQRSIEIMQQSPVDIYLLQEVDVVADRSYGINQVAEIREAFGNYGSTYASNLHSAFLAYPVHDMHGSVESGLLSLSNLQMDSSERYSYPASEGFLRKFFDLDRCFAVLRSPVQNGKELVVVHSHMSAYDEGGLVRKQQLAVLNKFLKGEYQKGNYIIVGGDFNHDYCESGELFLGNKRKLEWVYELGDADLETGFRFVVPENRLLTGTCRGSEEAYHPETVYEVIVDGFIVSDNIRATAQIIDTDYIASDHNPVVMNFELLP
ncbi:endonuclease [Aerococcaceae bacterium NML171108]|nr:endonuclease [Aerococcaceae bacterium NML171108]